MSNQDKAMNEGIENQEPESDGGEPVGSAALSGTGNREQVPSDEYRASSITVLEGLEAVRKRPAMYIGDTAVAGLHHCVYEVVDNSIDEAMAGVCKNILVKIYADGSCMVEDDGRGIPVDPMIHDNPALNGRPAVEVVMTVLHAGGKFDKRSYKVSAGLHGVGVSVVNALSEYLEVEVYLGGKVHAIRFERGLTARPLEVIGTTKKTGTRVQFKPDPEIFADGTFKYDLLATRLRELAYLNEGVRIQLVDEISGRTEDFYFADGLREFVRYLDNGKEALHKNVISFHAEEEKLGLICDVAMQYNDGYSETVLCFANNVHNIDGGTHLSGFRTALTRTMNAYAEKEGLLKSGVRPSGDDVREGLTAIISVKLPEPQFEAQTKVRLTNPEVDSFVQQVVNEQLGYHLEENPADAKRLLQKAIQAAQAREAARKARELARKTSMGGGGLPTKLWDCSDKSADDTELFLVEGDSAGGIAKQGRDSRTQAILPLKGKILNVEKARLDKMLAHDEIGTIIAAVGCGIGIDEFNIDKRRYDKIIIMCDADVDGSHIRTLLLTFLFRHMRPLVETGHVYVAQPPLYKLRKGKHSEYVLSDAVLNERLLVRGLEGAALVLRNGREERRIRGVDLRSLAGLLDGIEAQAKFLRRRGINFEEFVQSQWDPDGGLPTIRVQIFKPELSHPVETYVHTEDELRELRRSEEAAHPEFEVIDSTALSGDDGGTELSAYRIVRYELAECKKLNGYLRRLAEQGITVADYFAKREQAPSGESTPARFVLEDEQGSTLELNNIAEAAEGVRQLGSRGVEVRRYKGLGEMNADELWETTMDRGKRTLMRVMISEDTDAEQVDIDAREADRIFSILMGDNVEARRVFIETNALNVKNLDV
jgi:DNA gyrase subunit B